MNEARERDVIQLLKNLQVFHAGFGGTPPISETEGVTETSFGPAGFIYEGMEFRDELNKSARRDLEESLDLLEEALAELRRSNFPLYYILKDPYLQDPGDPSIVDQWRKLAPVSESCAARVSMHDKAVAFLAEYLEDEDLSPFYPRLMSEKESRDVEDGNAAMLAFYRRQLRRGSSHRIALRDTAEQYKVSEDYVQRIVDVKDAIGGALCSVEGCENQARATGLCAKHYESRRYKKFGRRKAS